MNQILCSSEQKMMSPLPQTTSIMFTPLVCIFHDATIWILCITPPPFKTGIFLDFSFIKSLAGFFYMHFKKQQPKTDINTLIEKSLFSSSQFCCLHYLFKAKLETLQISLSSNLFCLHYLNQDLFFWHFQISPIIIRL